MSLVVIVLIVLLLGGGAWGYGHAGWSGYGPGGLIGLVLVLLVIWLLVGGVR